MLIVDIGKIREASTKLDYGNRQLKGTRNVIEIIEVPQDFIYSGNLKRICTKLRTISNRLDVIERWMATSANKFDISENRNRSLINGMNNNMFRINLEYLINQYGTPEEIAKLEKREALEEEREKFKKSLYAPILTNTKNKIEKVIKNAVETVIDTVSFNTLLSIMEVTAAEFENQTTLNTNIKSNANNITFVQILGDSKFILEMEAKLAKLKAENAKAKKALKSYKGKSDVANARLIAERKLSENNKEIESLEHDIKDSQEIFSRNLNKYLASLPKKAASVVANIVSGVFQKSNNIGKITNNVVINEINPSPSVNTSKSTPNIIKVKTSSNKQNTNKYKLVFSQKIKTKLTEEYKINKEDVNTFIKLVKANKKEYNKVINKMVSKYANDPKEFKKIFGFALYKRNSKGEKVLNYTELLVDVFYVGNLYLEGAELLTKGENENVTINNDAYKMQDGKVMSTKLAGTSLKNVNEYIKIKKSNK